jgi:glutamyl-tRNA reductase
MTALGSVLALGINHHSAPLDLRSRLAFAAPQLPAALRSLRERLQRAAPEATLLSTCNRTELYVAAADARSAAELAQPSLDWLAQQGGLRSTRQLADHSYVMADGEAARHAFRVASGLDSMVLGEPQILGQIKVAVREAGLAGTLGQTLNQLFQRSFSVAKEVRSATDIGAHSVSMAAATVRLASQLFEDITQLNVLLVGAGEMIELMATHFASHHPRSMTVANRSLQRGEALAARFAARFATQGMQTMALADLPQRLGEFDVVVSCTASSLPLIGLGAVERALKSRQKLKSRRPMFMVDLAVPRDIEPEVKDLRDVYLYTVDDLAGLVQTAGHKRQQAVARAEEIVDAGVKSFAHWMEQRSNVPLIRALNQQADAWQASELARARRMLAKGGDVEAALQSLARGLSAKLLHGALNELHSADDAQRDVASDTVARLFLRQHARSPLTH